MIEATQDRRPQRERSIEFVQLGHQGWFEQGDEYIAILQWHSGTRVHRVMSSGYFMPARAGQLTWPGGEQKRLADVLSVLRGMSQQ